MAVQEDVIRRAVGWHHQDRRHAVRSHLSIGDALRLGRELMESFGYVPPELEAVSQPEPAGHVGVEVCVLREFWAAHRTTPFRCESCSGAWQSRAPVESVIYAVVTRASCNRPVRVVSQK